MDGDGTPCSERVEYKDGSSARIPYKKSTASAEPNLGKY